MQLAHDRALRSLGQVLDRLDLGLHLVEEADHVAALVELRYGAGTVVERLAADLLEASDALDGILDAGADGILDIRRSSAGIAHLDANLARGKAWKSLALQGGRRE